jgi:hypothetical protein
MNLLRQPARGCSPSASGARRWLKARYPGDGTRCAQAGHFWRRVPTLAAWGSVT